MDTSDKPKSEPEIGVMFRNGNLTVFGIVLSFSLGFLNTWTNNPNEWRLIDLPTLVMISIGIIFQAHAVWRLLRPSSLKRKVFEASNRQFGVGLLLTALGMMTSIALDLAHMLA